MGPLQRFIKQASAEATAKYSPELGALGMLLSNAAGDYSTARGAAAGAQRGTQASVNAALPFVQQAYQQAGGVNTGAQSLLSRDLAGLGAAADPFKAAAATEAQAATSRLAGAGAAATADLGSRYVRAADTANYLRGKAMSDYAGTKSQIAHRLSQITQESGAFTQGRVADLQNEADMLAAQAAQAKANRDVTIRGQDLSHQDRQASIAARGKSSPRLPGGAKLRPDKDHGVFQDDVSKATQRIRQELAHQNPNKPLTRAALGRILSNGVPGQVVKKGTVDPNTGKPLAADVRVPATAPFTGSQLALSVALDMAYDKHVSRHGFGGGGNVGRLHQRGFSVRKLGYPTTPPKGKQGFVAIPQIRPHQLQPVG